MGKGEVIEIGKHMCKEYFRMCLESINGDFGILDDDVQILGFKEDIEHNWYVMTFVLPKLDDYICQIIYNLSNKKIESKLFKLINL